MTTKGFIELMVRDGLEQLHQAMDRDFTKHVEALFGGAPVRVVLDDLQAGDVMETRSKYIRAELAKREAARAAVTPWDPYGEDEEW